MAPITAAFDLLYYVFTAAGSSVIAMVSVALVFHGRYQPPLRLGWLVALIGMILMCTITESTGNTTIFLYQAVTGTGMGTVYSVTLLPVLKSLSTPRPSHLRSVLCLRMTAQVSASF